MAGQDIIELKLTFDTEVDQSDVKIVDQLIATLDKLNDFKVSDKATSSLASIEKALRNFKGVSVNAYLGKGITNLVEAVNQMTEVKDITPYAENLTKSFKVISDATKAFEGNVGRTPLTLGRAITDLVTFTNKMTEIQDITPYAENLNRSFKVISDATRHFDGNNAKISLTLGRSVTGIVEASNKIEEVKDISSHAKTLDNNFKAISAATKSFEGNSAKIPINLGRSISGLVDAVNRMTEVKDISSQAFNLTKSFRTISNATKSFDGNNAKISVTLGQAISGLVESVNRITEVKDISSYANILKRNFKAIAEATKHFEGNTARIPVSLGRSITDLVTSTNQMTEVKDISAYTKILENNFKGLSAATKHFEGNNARIPVNLGKGITGLIDSSNQMTQVKDISRYAAILKNNFKTIAEATRHFSGLSNINYSGIGKLVQSMTTMGRIKPIGNAVLTNAKTFAQAINIMGKNVTVDTPKIEAMAKATNSLGREFRNSSNHVRGFGAAMKVINFASFIYLARRAATTLAGLVRGLYSTVDAFGGVQNTMSFFSQALGTESQRVANVIQGYADTGLVTFTEFADQTAKLTQIYRGYGISVEEAAHMSLNLTQLAYDASYALGENGKDIDMWNKRALSVATGQTRAGYYFGVDTSITSLREEFDELTASADKATKSKAAFNVMMENTAAIQGQAAREYQNAYVQMDVLRNRVIQLKEAIGLALVPVFQQLIKWALIALRVVELVINGIVRLFGGKGFGLINYAGMIDGMASSAGGATEATKELGGAANDVAGGMAKANKQAKELKKTISGIDQVFTIDDSKPSPSSAGGSGGGIGGIGGGGVGLGGLHEGYDWDELTSMLNMDMLDDIDKKAESIYQSVRNAAPYVAAIAAGFALWKISKGFMDALTLISGTKGLLGGIGLSAVAFPVGLLLFADNLIRFAGYLDDFLKGGSRSDDLYNISGMLTSFVGSIASIATLTGNIKLGGFLFVVQGVTDVLAAIADMITEGDINWDNVTRLIKGLGSVAIGFGLLKGQWAMVGTGLIMNGAIEIIKQVAENWDQIKKGDFSGLANAEMLIAALSVLGGVVLAIKKFKDVTDASNKGGEIVKAPETIETVSTATGGVSTKLVTLIQNMALGVGILALAAAGTLLFVGAIWAMGEMLQKVGEAWRPVIEDGEMIASGIALGTVLLVGVGGAAYLLGTATVASGGSIPIAIGVGSAMLVLLSAAVVLFVKELTIIANKLSKDLAPALSKLNKKMPDLNKDLRSYTKFMAEFAGHMVANTFTNAVSGIAGSVDTIIGWFTQDPIKKLAKDVDKNYKQFTNLNKSLSDTNPLIRKAISMMKQYGDLLEELNETAKRASDIASPVQIGINFKSFSKALRDGFADLDKTKTQNVANIMRALNSLDLNKFRGIGTDIVKAMELGINNYSFNFAKATGNIRRGLTFSGYSIGTNIAQGVQNGINNFYPNTTIFTNRLKRGMRVSFEVKSPSRWARDVIGGNIALGVMGGINESKIALDPFKDNVSNALHGVKMPTLDTSTINGSIANVASRLNAKVQGQFDYTNDGTEKAIAGLTSATIELNERLIKAVEDGKVITIDGEAVGKVSDEYSKSNAVRLNAVFGR